jgi:hypothetical protein
LTNTASRLEYPRQAINGVYDHLTKTGFQSAWFMPPAEGAHCVGTRAFDALVTTPAVALVADASPSGKTAKASKG